ncbi:hypothetical protein C8N43_1471 [Litoreibacter ponti]|uniref:Uncharacterized protein n=1 Tax=Litoreibacter ponti TaxID=1510457 RepID=A0A2T6BL82_9RHOB|nr:hypothetical protein [Litoreibacter ponti]PTX56807.1 hypothetical protein C8N43_1471 [Litoreibacter ponti]
MSDSVTKSDVEDVLSSIRRLVSDTAAHERDAEDTPDTDEESRAPEALVLTSEQRVNNDREDDVELPEASEMTNLREAVSTEEGEQDGIDWPSIAGADEYYEDDETEGETPIVDFIRHDSLTPRDDVAEEAPEVATEEENDQDDATSDRPSEGWSPQIVADNTVAADEIDTPDWISAGHADIDDADHEEVAEASPEQDFETPSEEDEFEDAEELPDDEPEIWNVEEAETVEDDATDPDEESLVEEAEFASAAAASVIDADEAELEDGPSLGDFDEGLIDEDALRDLVAQIVREELTGELGEKITRNVRKLVRREIHRAMLTREFD